MTGLLLKPSPLKEGETISTQIYCPLDGSLMMDE